MKKPSAKNRNKIDKAEFKKRYAELSVRVKAIKAKLKDALKDAHDLSKRAYALRRLGNENLYTEDSCGIRPAFKGLPRKMDTLEMWENIEFDIGFVISGTIGYC